MKDRGGCLKGDGWRCEPKAGTACKGCSKNDIVSPQADRVEASSLSDLLAGAKRDARKYKKYLKRLTENVKICLAALDAEMNKPPTNERGRRIAKISNALEMENDQARHFGLDLPLGKKK